MFQSVRIRLMAAFLFLVFLPGAAAVGLAFSRSTEIVRNDSIKMVAWVAEEKHELLRTRLTRQKERAQGFLATVLEVCGNSEKIETNNECARQALTVFKGTEDVLGARLHLKEAGDFFAGTKTEKLSPPLMKAKGQVVSMIPLGKGRYDYLIHVEDRSRQNSLTLRHSATFLENTFLSASEFGKGGVTYLVDGNGRFITQGGHLTHTHSLERCLSGETSASVDPDDQNASVIHGFRYVPEIGGGCILAQVNQAYAFAPLVAFEHSVLALFAILFLVLFALAYVVARRFSLQFSLPIARLEARVRKAEAGDLDSEVPIEGPPEVRAIAKGFAAMTQSLKKSIQSREDLLSIVSHDLMNPLSAIILGSAFLRRRLGSASHSLDPVVVTQVRIVEGAANRMKALVSELHDLGKIQSGTFHLRKEPHDVSKIGSEVVEMLNVIAAEKKVRLVSNLEAFSDRIECDPGRLYQVFSNLIGNAIKFTPEGGVVRVTRRKDSRVDGHLEFTVEDNGPGIPPEQVSRVFDRYWKGKVSQPSGSGLGLYISKAIVEGHGGRIWVESSIDEGCAISFSLPVKPVIVPGLTSFAGGASSQSEHLTDC